MAVTGRINVVVGGNMLGVYLLKCRVLNPGTRVSLLDEMFPAAQVPGLLQSLL